MAETIHFSEKFRTALAKYFAYKSVTDHLGVMSSSFY